MVYPTTGVNISMIRKYIVYERLQTKNHSRHQLREPQLVKSMYLEN